MHRPAESMGKVSGGMLEGFEMQCMLGQWNQNNWVNAYVGFELRQVAGECAAALWLSGGLALWNELKGR